MASFEVLIDGKVERTILLPRGESGSTLHYLMASDGGSEARLVDQREPGYLAAMTAAGARWVVMVPPGDRSVVVNDVSSVGLKVLDHGDRLTIGSLHLRFEAQSVEILSAESPLLAGPEKRCQICQKKFEVDAQVIYCPRCNLAHHFGAVPGQVDCWNAYGRCGSRPWCGYSVPAADDPSRGEQ